MTQSVEKPETAPDRRAPPTALTTALRNGSALPAWMWLLALAVLLGVSWLVTYVVGGSSTAFPHLFYLPVILSALPFGLRGAWATAAVATVLCGPFMPLVTETAQPQAIGNWVLRGVFFATVATLTAFLIALHERTFERQITAEFRQELDRSAAATTAEPIPPDLIHRVVTERLFHPVFQPIYSLQDGHLRSVEALTRFDVEPAHPPNVWFDAARRAGMGVALELCALEAAFAGCTDVPADVALSVNVGPGTLIDPRFPAIVQAAGPRTLIIEVTEHDLVTDYRLLQECLEVLRAQGVLIAVDDVGAGISNMLHVVKLAPDIIKLDLSLAQDVESSPVRRAMGRALVDFANHTGTDVVVEGIEHSGDLRAWADLGAHAVQGYFVGRPGRPPFATSSAHIVPRRPSRP